MLINWTQHLKDPEAKANFEQRVWASKEILDHIYKLLDKQETDTRMAQETIGAYDKPNWEYRTAHQNGYLACLRNLKALVNLDQQRETNEPVRPTARKPERT